MSVLCYHLKHCQSFQREVRRKGGYRFLGQNDPLLQRYCQPILLDIASNAWKADMNIIISWIKPFLDILVQTCTNIIQVFQMFGWTCDAEVARYQFCCMSQTRRAFSKHFFFTRRSTGKSPSDLAEHTTRTTFFLCSDWDDPLNIECARLRLYVCIYVLNIRYVYIHNKRKYIYIYT